MSDSLPYRGNGPTVGISQEARDRLHRRLDELLNLHNEMAEWVDQSEMSEELADRLQHRAEQLVIRACRFAGEVAGGHARAIAFRHPEPTSRKAFSRFLGAVAEYAAPYEYASRNLGIETFTWTDARAWLDDLRSLEHGDLPPRMKPQEKAKKRGATYGEILEWWRATLWVQYLEGMTHRKYGEPQRTGAISQVAKAYGISTRRLYDWMEESSKIKDELVRHAELGEAWNAGEIGGRPFFTLSPYDSHELQTYRDWLRHDSEQLKRMNNQ